MGGIFLILALVGVYIVVFWSIHIELKSDKTTGLLGLISEASETLHGQAHKVKSFGLRQIDLNKSEKHIRNQSVFIKSSLHKKEFCLSKDSFIAKFKKKFSKTKPNIRNAQEGLPRKPFLKK